MSEPGVPPRRDEPALERSLDRQLLLGLVFGALLLAGFPLYALREPDRRARAAREQHESYVRLGADQYRLHCASCHGPEGGGGGTAPTLRAKELLDNVSDTQLRWLIAGGLPGTTMSAYHIDFGGPFTDQHVDEVVTYLRSLETEAVSVPGWKQGMAAPARTARREREAGGAPAVGAPAGESPAGEAPAGGDATGGGTTGGGTTGGATAGEAPGEQVAPVYAQYCAACHGAAGQGVTGLGSALLTPAYRAQRADSTIRLRIAQGVPGTAMMAFARSRGGPLTPAQIEALVIAIRRGRLAP